MKKMIMLGTLLVLMAIVAMPSAMASTFKLIPQHSTGTPGGSTYVNLTLDATDAFAGYQVDINFNNLIVDIPAGTVAYQLWGGGTTTSYGNFITLVANAPSGTAPAGTYVLATLKLDGKSTIGVSDLNISNNMLSDDLGDPLINSVINGTYTNLAHSKPDLIVTKTDPSKTIFVDATNVFTIYVKNQGTADVTGNFDVAWQITDDDSTVLASGTSTINGLNIGQEKSFDFNWKPTVLQNTTVKATVDSGGVVDESSEINNNLSVKYVQNEETISPSTTPGILPLSMWGYGGNKPLTNYKSGIVNGGLMYTFGNSVYLGGYANNWSTTPYKVNFSIGTDVNRITGITESIGSGTVKEARLYMYYNYYRYPDAGRPADPEEKLNMAFNGYPITTVVKYEDAKGFGSYRAYKYGTFVYNVTPYVTGDGTYQAVITNLGEGDTHGTSIYGMALQIIYEDSSKPKWEYHIAEGYELLTQYYLASGRYQYHVIPEDATSTFNMPASTGTPSTLFTVTTAAADGGDTSRLYFNTPFWSSPWTYIPVIQMGIDARDVTSYKADPNTVKFQSKPDGYGATNAILISKKGLSIDLGGPYDTEVGRHIMVPITANDFKQFYGTVEMNFTYNHSKFDFVAVYSNPKSTVTAHHDYPGILDISALNTAGVKGDVVLATVELNVVGGDGTDDHLGLTVDLLEDIYGATIDQYTVPATVSIGTPPVGVITVASVTSTPNSSKGQGLVAILNENGRARHTGDNEVLISANVASTLGIDTVTVNLSAIGGSATTLMSGTGPGTYTVMAKATAGINTSHNFVVTAKDTDGNTDTKSTVSPTILRRGDVMRNNIVNMGDALYIARYTVGLETPSANLFEFVGDVMDASGGSSYTVNMGDALYIARYSVGLEPAP